MIKSHINNLQSKGFRITSARSAIINLLESTPHPITANSIHKLLKKVGTDVNITTVYREIEFLLSQKIINKIQLFDTELHYEMADRTHHHHIVCTDCKAIEDLKIDSEKDLLDEVCSDTRYKISTHSLTFYGVCPACK
ncbi:hypothetical protein COV58_00115 [Candidatus Roizmanbacteria bacterium CG11_big_fil_rev_8_21_14_0_20_36_8]|uniref:Transcriptional repressor n=1 Tax=Candidatus Roizmanbacteria bacterium CG11_big_fil_rev_8_21_14_0_20_36_8 TaxID=1974856 RepID=A0A2M6IVC7_9BACT|nr:MAG: hypothetical protein COV58_00115 [Candidatus Roizmanbacteria bacterium CG11_big_fil_rev_8_21_14_0_20_36_8]